MSNVTAVAKNIAGFGFTQDLTLRCDEQRMVMSELENRMVALEHDVTTTVTARKPACFLKWTMSWKYNKIVQDFGNSMIFDGQK